MVEMDHLIGSSFPIEPGVLGGHFFRHRKNRKNIQWRSEGAGASVPRRRARGAHFLGQGQVT